MPSRSYHLLTLCARAVCDATQHGEIAQAATGITDWQETVAQAEAHGLGPLLYTHTKAARVPLPAPVRRELQGLYLRHRHASQVRSRVLCRILAAYETAGIQALVLKGGALAHLLYPEPGLRPTSDLDLLVHPPQALHAQRVLAEIGFSAPIPPENATPTPDVHPANLLAEGLLVTIDIHPQLVKRPASPLMDVERLAARALPFTLGQNDCTAYTLGYEELLWHLCLHLRGHADVFRSHRLIWMADIRSLAERFVAEIDWERVARHYPLVLSTLSLLHTTLPLSQAVLHRVPLRIGRTPGGVGQDFRGWPHASLAAQRDRGWRGILCDTFWPSEWWLRLHHGLGSAEGLFWTRWVRHPLEIWGWIAHWLRGGLRRRRKRRR
jgi:hypothetical protein